MIHERSDALDVLDDRKEHVVAGLWQGTGVSGGEITLYSNTLDPLKVRPNDWVMVSGSYDVSGVGSGPLITRFQWYRISDCEAEPSQSATKYPYELNATLIGQDWNPSYFTPTLNGVTQGNVRVTIVEGAFAVYEKTVRLEYGSTF